MRRFGRRRTDQWVIVSVFFTVVDVVGIGVTLASVVVVSSLVVSLVVSWGT